MTINSLQIKLDSITKYWKFDWSLNILHSHSISRLLSILVNDKKKIQDKSKCSFLSPFIGRRSRGRTASFLYSNNCDLKVSWIHHNLPEPMKFFISFNCYCAFETITSAICFAITDITYLFSYYPLDIKWVILIFEPTNSTSVFPLRGRTWRLV